MNYKLTITLAVLIGLYGCQQESEQTTAAAQTGTDGAPATAEVATDSSELGSGIDPLASIHPYAHRMISLTT